jgi:6-pyruvoyltetrahydropterin/6-carboxytetrahydropterin synthase
MYELKVVTKFAAAHQLTMVGTKCENMHGHNWKIEVYVTVIKKHVRDIMSLLDHKYLNELEFFQQSQPSSENIAYWVADKLQQKIDNSSVKVSRVTAWESDDACATYIVDQNQ